MANTSIPRGLIPVRYRSGAPYNGGYNTYFIPATNATALFIGDPVVPVTAAADGNGVPVITHAAAAGGSFVLGSVVGIVSDGDVQVNRTADSPVHRLASTAAYVMVADDPELLFEIQEDGVGGAMGQAAGSRNADLVSGTGSAFTGYSGWMLDSSTLAVTATLQLRILKAVQRADNDPTLTLAKWLVHINLHNARSTLGI
jgi:hypothetical protein